MPGPKTGPQNDRQVGWNNLANCVIYDQYIVFMYHICHIYCASETEPREITGQSTSAVFF